MVQNIDADVPSYWIVYRIGYRQVLIPLVSKSSKAGDRRIYSLSTRQVIQTIGKLRSSA